ncbi:conserved oligomeric Golgi complex subunit 1-like [Palaemon carinicauda]|uniref:conserved oligomeric Golgi complex subunit 1-like n=1 Tax=Palaemon carinicauda TaxID=392227 RepID=UPI0035B5E930
MSHDDEVTLLFENNTVPQVQEILTKTRNNIERKKEDLRIMVGERYRDLIEAADTIAEMQESANAICKNIQTMEGLCESLQQRGLIGFKTKSHPVIGNDRSSTSGNHHSLAVQVKLLVTIPETLWSLTEHGQYLQATQLLLLAHHTHTALQLSPNAAKVTSWFPVIERQWASITQFRSTIVRGCSNLISTEVDDTQAVLDAMVSIMLVEGCSSKELLSRVLQLRHSSLMAVVTPKPSAIAKAQISQFVTLFVASLNIIYAIFAEENGKSLLERRLQEVVQIEGDDSSPVSLLQESSLTLSFLPQSIRQFRPSVHGSTEALGNQFVKTKVITWLNSVLGEVSQSLSTLLSFTTSVKALAMIRSSVWEICEEKIEWTQWNKITGTLYGDKLDPWDSLVRNQVTERARQVISSQLSSMKEAIIQMVTKLASDIAADPKIAHDEGDISNFIWSESAGDLPERVGWTSAASRTVSQAGGLYFKTRGYTSRLQTICRALNSRLTALMQDVANFSSESPKEYAYQFEKETPSADKERNAAEDYSSLLSFLQDASSSTFVELVLDLEKLAKQYQSVPSPERHNEWDEDIWTASHSPALTILVVVGRICQALPNVCPQMQICASAANLTNPDVARRVSLGSRIESESWSKVHLELQNTSSRLFGLFLGSLTDTLNTELKDSLTSELSRGAVEAIISSFPTWESVTIEEEGEGGNIVKSSIYVPGHPTPVLSQALAHLCSSVNCVAAHTITRNAQSELIAKVCEAVTSAYESALDEAKEINQTLALQLIFDLRFVQSVLLPRESKEVAARVMTMIQKLEHQVDPFDLDVFSPHITTRVKLAAHRVQVIFGTVLSRDQQVLSGRVQSTSSTSASTNNALPIILPVEIPRFSNVPLPVSTSRPTIPSSMSTPTLSLSSSVADHTPSKMTSSKGQSSPSSVRREMSSAAMSASRSAASLFSAMSSSWFGGSSAS